MHARLGRQPGMASSTVALCMRPRAQRRGFVHSLDDPMLDGWPFVIHWFVGFCTSSFTQQMSRIGMCRLDMYLSLT